MRPYDALSTFDALPANEMPLLDTEQERAEIDRLLGIVYEEIPEDQPATEQEAA